MQRALLFSMRAAARGAQTAAATRPSTGAVRFFSSSRSRFASSSSSSSSSGSNNNASPFLLVIPAITAGLGTWQVFRKKKKEELIAHLEERLQGDPRPLPNNLEEVSGMEYNRVFLDGEFLHDREILVFPRTKVREAFTNMGDLPEPGAFVITPFRRSDNGQIVLVNRGFVPDNIRSASARQQGQVQGPQHIEAIVRLGERKGQFVPENHPERGEWHWIDVKGMADAAGSMPILVDACSSATPSGGYPLGGQTQINIRNQHLEYIITWYSLTVLTTAMWVIARRKPATPARRLPPPIPK